MRKRSAPDRSARRAALAESPLQLASAIADGTAPDIAPGSGDRLRDGLALISRIAERIGAVSGRIEVPPQHPALFQWCHLDVLQQIGEGSHAQVYRAWDPLLAIEVALKLSHPDRAATVTQAWLDEARRMARLRHPNVVSVYGIDQENGRTGIWLELVKGESLHQRRLREGGPGLKEWCLAGIDLARGVGAIHRTGMVHGDLKPANLLRDPDGRVLIADFGAAAMQSRPTAARQGTPLTMAPEVLRGGAGTIASDLYSMGAVLFWLATGKWPREAATLDELIVAHDRPVQHALPDHFPPALVRLLLSLLSSDPAQRPESAEAVEHVLASALHASPQGGERSDMPDARERAHFSRIVGRDAELAYLQHEYERARNGHALPVLIEGESGSGKSFLLSHFGKWVGARGGRFLQVTLGADPATPRLAAALAHAIRMHDDTIDEDTFEPAAAIGRLAGRSKDTVLVLALDGLRHADEAERPVVRRLIASVPASVLVVGTLRTDADRPGADSRWFGDGPVGVLRLRPFAASQMEDIIGAMLDLADPGDAFPEETCAELHRLSGGNPFYLSELLRHILLAHGAGGSGASSRWPAPAQLPANLQLLALDRCSRLPEATRKLLDAAAALGERFQVDWLAAASGTRRVAFDAALQPAIAAAVLDHDDDGLLRFRHGLIRQAWYENLPGERRRDLHRACMRNIAFADEAEQQRLLAWHAGQAGESDLSFAAGYRAFVGLARPGQLDVDGLEQLLCLLRNGARATGVQRWNTALAHARALRQRGRLADARAALERMRHDFRVRPHGPRDQQLLIERSHVAFALGEHQQVLDDLRPLVAPATDVSSRSPQRFREARLLAIRASTAKGDFVAAGEQITQALAKCRYGSDDHVALRTLQGWGLALLGRLSEADRILAGTLRLVDLGRIETRGDLLRRLAFVAMERGRYQAACHHAQQAHDAFRRLADAMGQAKCRLMLAEIRSAQGLHDEALGYLKRVIPELDEIGDRHCEAEAHWCLAQAWRLRGEMAEARTGIERALQLIEEVGDRDDEARFLIEFARIELASGMREAALAHARQAGVIGRELASDVTVALAAVEEAAAQLADGAVELATGICARAARTLRDGGVARVRGAEWLLGRCALARGAPHDAVIALQSACRSVDRIVDELPHEDRGRRARLQSAWQPLVEDYASALEQCSETARADALRQRWRALASGA